MTDSEIFNATRNIGEKFPGYRAYAAAGLGALIATTVSNVDHGPDIIQDNCRLADAYAKEMSRLEERANG